MPKLNDLQLGGKREGYLLVAPTYLSAILFNIWLQSALQFGNILPEENMRLPTAHSIYAPENRTRLLSLATVLVVVIALVDWRIEPYISLGFLYLFPIMIAGGFLSRTKIVSLAVLCALLQEEFSNLPPGDVVTRLVLSSAGFVGTGLFISELLRNRRIVLSHVQELENQVQLRREAEEQLLARFERPTGSVRWKDETPDRSTSDDVTIVST